jgi:nucleotide-binding universal stress UspA family protein
LTPGAAERQSERVGPFRRILATTDLSEFADRAVRVAFEMASCCDARVILCHVLEPAARPNPLYAHYAPVDSVPADTLHRVDMRAHHELETRIPPEFRDRTDIAIVHGPVADEILATAEHHHADLIVIATHGMTGLLERVMGGVAYKVVRHAKCPVLVMR